MPFWVPILINLIVKFGLPEVEEHWPATKDLIQNVLNAVKTSDNPADTIAQIAAQTESTVPSPGDLKKE